MLQHGLQLDAIAGSDAQTLPDQILALASQTRSELELGHADLLILLKRDIAADHVVEEDSQRPNGGGIAVVARASDPFGRGVHTRA